MCGGNSLAFSRDAFFLHSGPSAPTQHRAYHAHARVAFSGGIRDTPSRRTSRGSRGIFFGVRGRHGGEWSLRNFLATVRLVFFVAEIQFSEEPRHVESSGEAGRGGGARKHSHGVHLQAAFCFGAQVGGWQEHEAWQEHETLPRAAAADARRRADGAGEPGVRDGGNCGAVGASTKRRQRRGDGCGHGQGTGTCVS